MSPRSDTAGILAPPPILLFACVLLAWGLGFLRPFGLDLSLTLRLALGNGMLLAAFALAIAALLVMRRHHTPAEPWKPTTRIVTDGPFRFTRNPIYIALLLVLASIGVLTASGWFLMLVPGLFLLLHCGVVRPEERYLSMKFGDEYRTYMNRVRRWI